jgi:hypothetical protein
MVQVAALKPKTIVTQVRVKVEVVWVRTPKRHRYVAQTQYRGRDLIGVPNQQ